MINILFGDELPGPRDAAFISLSNACGIFQRILAPDEYEEAREKIDIYARFDRLGRAVVNAIQAVTVAESQAMRRVIHQQGGGVASAEQWLADTQGFNRLYNRAVPQPWPSV